MSNITTDFITATKKIHADVRSILTTLHLVQGDVKSIREQVVQNADKPHPDPNRTESGANPQVAMPASVQHVKAGQPDRDKNKNDNCKADTPESLKHRWLKAIRKPTVQIEIVALIGLGIYTCETRKTNTLTQEALNLQFSLSRAFVQVTATDFMKSSFDDVQKAGQFYLELQNVGKLTASKVHGDFYVELPVSSQDPPMDFTKYHTQITNAPLYPGSPQASINIIFVSDYGTVQTIPPGVIQQLKDGTRYAIIFGRLEYEDSVGQWWIQFCGWRHYMPPANPPHIIGFSAKKCVDFNVEGGTPKKQD